VKLQFSDAMAVSWSYGALSSGVFLLQPDIAGRGLIVGITAACLAVAALSAVYSVASRLWR
jgi:hypothetical protein